MKTIDHYIARQFIGPFFVGVAAFVAILLGIGQIYDAVQLVVRDGFPIGMVLQWFFLRIPTVVALTMPMATVFAALMASGELSSRGEIVAMRAGGVSVWRMAVPVLVAGAGVSVVAFVFNEAIGPACNNRATTMLHSYLREERDIEKPVWFRMPEQGEAQRFVYADKAALAKQVMTNVAIIEFDKGKPREVFFAERAEWRGETWVLMNVVHKRDTGRGYSEEFVKEIRYDIGRSPADIKLKRQKRPEDLTLGELLAESRRLAPARGVRVTGRNRPLKLIQHFHIRIAAPWAAFCFAILGFPLGMRPQRASTGVGFGISLAIVFVYYIVINVLRAFGEQGALSPLLAAWTANVVVIGVGLGLMLEASR